MDEYARRTSGSRPAGRGRNVALRRQQSRAQRTELVLGVRLEGGDRLAVDSGGSGVGTDLSPRERQVGRIGDGLQQLAHGQHLPWCSASPLTPSTRSGGQSRQPARRWWTGPVHPGQWRSLRGLVSVGPFAGHHPPSRAGGPPAHFRAAGQRALPRLQHYYEPSDSSEDVGLPFPHGLWRRLPDLHRSADRAIEVHRSPIADGPGVVCEYCSGPCEVSLDRSTNDVATARRNHRKEPRPPGHSGDAVASHAVWRLRGRVFGFPDRGQVTTPDGLPSVHSGSSQWLCLRPLRTPGHPDALGLSYRTSTTKARKDFHLLAPGVARRTGQQRPPPKRGALSGEIPAASYSPRGLPPKYHRRWRA